MTRPRRLVPGTVFVTRNVRERQFRLRPDEQTTAIIGYILAVFIQRHRLLLHAVCFMSNHWHGVITTPRDVDPGALAAFTRDLHSFIARHLGATFGDVDGMWSRHQTSHVALLTLDDVIDKMIYVVCNPVAARLVTEVHHWPGVLGRWPDRAQTYRRPAGFFNALDDNTPWPDVATLSFSPPEEPRGR